MQIALRRSIRNVLLTVAVLFGGALISGQEWAQHMITVDPGAYNASYTVAGMPGSNLPKTGRPNHAQSSR